MTAKRVQALLPLQLRAHASVRRRCVPPSQPGPVSQSQNQRWRERPRCAALPVAPERRDGVVHASVGGVLCRCHACAARARGTRRPRAPDCVQVRREQRVGDPLANRVRLSGNSSWKNVACGESDFAPDTIASLNAGAVLGVVNALRFASTRPRAGPSGIDDASTRHVSGSYAMVVRVNGLSDGVDVRIAQEYVGVITSVPHGTSSVRPKGQRSAHPAGAHRARHRAHPPHFAAVVLARS